MPERPLHKSVVQLAMSEDYISIYIYIYVYVYTACDIDMYIIIIMCIYIYMYVYIYTYIYIYIHCWLVVSTPWKILVRLDHHPNDWGKTIRMFQTTNQIWEKWLEPLGPASTDPIHHNLASSIWEWPHGHKKEGLLGPWGPIKSRGFIWSYIVLYGFKWFYMVLYGFIWFYMVLS